MTDDNHPPEIISEHGKTTEWARKQAALNIARDPVLRDRLFREYGEAWVRDSYPEAFQEEPDDL